MSRLNKVTLSFVVFGTILGLQGCATYTSNGNGNGNSNGNGYNITLSSAEDPDGDGDNKGADYFPKHRAATGGKVFIFDPNYTAWAVYDQDGNLANTGKASGGKLYCEDVGRRCTTISGTFRIISKHGEDCISTKYPIETNGGAPMPYCMYFSDKGYGIHGSYDIPDHNASHGCIRITPIAARWLNEDFLPVGSKVIVLPYH